MSNHFLTGVSDGAGTAEADVDGATSATGADAAAVGAASGTELSTATGAAADEASAGALTDESQAMRATTANTARTNDFIFISPMCHLKIEVYLIYHIRRPMYSV